MAWEKRERKYLIGPKIETIYELVHRINVGAYTMIWGRPTHALVLRNQSLATLMGWVSSGAAREARINPKYVPRASKSADTDTIVF